MNDKLKEIAVALGAKEMKKIYDWNGYEVHEAVYNFSKPAMIGYPDYALVKGDGVRLADIDEVFEIMRHQDDMDNKNKEKRKVLEKKYED